MTGFRPRAGERGAPRGVSLTGMSDPNVDPSGSTEQFKAFVQHTEPASTRSFPVGAVVGGVAAIVVVAIVVLIFAL